MLGFPSGFGGGDNYGFSLEGLGQSLGVFRGAGSEIVESVDDFSIFEAGFVNRLEVFALYGCSTDAVSPELGYESADFLHIALNHYVCELELAAWLEDSMNFLECFALLGHEV